MFQKICVSDEYIVLWCALKFYFQASCDCVAVYRHNNVCCFCLSWTCPRRLTVLLGFSLSMSLSWRFQIEVEKLDICHVCNLNHQALQSMGSSLTQSFIGGFCDGEIPCRLSCLSSLWTCFLPSSVSQTTMAFSTHLDNTPTQNPQCMSMMWSFSPNTVFLSWLRSRGSSTPSPLGCTPISAKASFALSLVKMKPYCHCHMCHNDPLSSRAHTLGCRWDSRGCVMSTRSFLTSCTTRR